MRIILTRVQLLQVVLLLALTTTVLVFPASFEDFHVYALISVLDRITGFVFALGAR